LEKNGIKYVNLDVAENREARDKMVKKSGRLAVPVIEVNGEIIIGFDEAKLREKLGL
jgi:glutaredoxin 3